MQFYNPQATASLVAFALQACVGPSTGEVSHTVPSPYERKRIELDTAKAELDAMHVDIGQALAPLIKQANEKGAARKGQIFLCEEEYERALVFVPILEDNFDREQEQIEDLYARKKVLDLPPHAIVREWTDHFALAQEMWFEYTTFRIYQVTETGGDPYFQALVELELRAEIRDVLVSQAQPIPLAPEGMKTWEEPRYLTGSGAKSSLGSTELPRPGPWPGILVKSTEVHSDLARSAIEGMSQKKPKKESFRILIQLGYDGEEQDWKLIPAPWPVSVPQPRVLGWSQGLPEDSHVLKPERLRQSKD